MNEPTSGPKWFRKTYYGRLPEPDELKWYLQMKLDQMEGLDAWSDYHHHLGDIQEYVLSWPRIYDYNGSL